ncbi:RagB/SusD family nutrient uptake outer membrane protein [Aquirufa sp. ROCK-SH2]
MKNKLIYLFSFALICSLSSCEQEYLNPSAASEQQVVNDVNGLITLCNGLQYRYTISRVSPIYTSLTANGLMSKELTVLNAGNTDEEYLRLGGANVQGVNTVVTQLWAQNHIIKANADLILKNIDKAADPGIKAGIISAASIFRALALGNLATYWEKAPIQVGTNASFNTREELLKEAIKQLELAAGSAGNISAAFVAKVPSGIDYPNTIQALIARYNLMLGNYDQAISAADKVNLTKKSVFIFDDLSRNPMFDATFSNRNVTEPFNNSFGLPNELKPDASDKRIAFFFNSTAGQNLGRASFFTANTAQLPIYRPSEMTLIRAEALARKNSLSAAVTEINKILTKKTDVLNINADMAEYAGGQTQTEILQEIYKQRCIELFLSGLKVEDSRRFGRPSSERTRSFLPYPQNERDNNTSTPSDPSF